MFMNKSQSIVLDRRKFLAGAAALVAAGVLPRQVLALAGPQTFKQGNYDVTVASDGQLVLPASIIAPDAPPEEVAKLAGMMVKDGKVTVAANPLLLKSASDTILLDTGSGQGFQDTAGKIGETLKAAGVDPASVTKVIFTHAHPDHCWGTSVNGQLAFPNASLHMDETEWNFWTNKDLASRMPKEMQGMVMGTQGQLDVIKDRITLFKPGAELVPGLMALGTPGHTPGHTSFELAGGDGMIIGGDAIPVPEVYFPHPEWTFAFDADAATATKSRLMLLDMAAAGKKKFFGYHWQGSGMGFAEKKDGAYQFVAAA